MNLSQFWNALPPTMQEICVGSAGEIIGGLSIAALTKLAKRDRGKVIAGFLREWQERALDQGDPDSRVRAFEAFFKHHKVQVEFRKVLRGDFAMVDFELLERELQASCRKFKAVIPGGDLYSLLEKWLEDLVDFLRRDSPDYREANFTPIVDAITALRGVAPAIRNYSLARRAYMDHVVHDRGQIALRGFERPKGIDYIDLDHVFVMPQAGEIPADELLRGPDKRLVILGKPGAGKTTLLSRFAVGMARRENGYPPLLPVFYRAREYREDRTKNPGKDLFGCLEARLAEAGLRLPTGFFDRQSADGGVALLVDGLDEVQVEAERTRMMADVDALARRVAMTVVSSRPHEYERSPFSSQRYAHHQLEDFDDQRIQRFISNWREVGRSAGGLILDGHDLWEAIRAQKYLKGMAGNPLLLTMIACVDLWKGRLPDSRVELYRICSESLVHDWSRAAGDELLGIGQSQKLEFLAELAYTMQCDASTQVNRGELRKRLKAYLGRERLDAALLDPLMDRLYMRDAILVNQGGDVFGFVHRQFQEYLAARWMVDHELDLKERLGTREWNETVYLGVAMLNPPGRRRFLLDLLHASRAAEAYLCMSALPDRRDWLPTLVRFLAKYTWEGREHAGMPAAECRFDEERKATEAVLEKVFAERRDGEVLAAAVELAEELGLARLLEPFWEEGGQVRREMVQVDGFWMDRFPVTNEDYERMIPGHAARTCSQEFHGPRRPVVMVNWHAARLYARWSRCRLPTEQEWEKAAGAPRLYPWGDDESPETVARNCNTREHGPHRTTDVGSYPGGASPYGCEDMAGNVWEWTDSWYDEGRQRRVVRGGSWLDDGRYARCACRGNGGPEVHGGDLGFRSARI